MAWVSPTGFVDPSYSWIGETLVYDEDTATCASSSNPGSYLELTLSSAINCDQVRIWGNKSGSQNTEVDVDVFYGGAWHNIHSGTIIAGQWNELPIGSTQSVDAARTKSDVQDMYYLYEFDFNEVEAPPPTRRIFITHQ